MIRDITRIVLMQKKESEFMYEDAMETNYSHEQMTPLNCILTSSKIVLQKMEWIEANKSPNKKLHYIELVKCSKA